MDDDSGDDRARRPWLLVAGGFHQGGGMDKANAALAHHLLMRGHPVHLVAHDVEPTLGRHPGVRLNVVPRPLGSVLLGESLLRRTAWRIASRLDAKGTRARVVANGGNCSWPDLNWVHFVHHAWAPAPAGAPWLRAKTVVAHRLARRRERSACTAARLVIANSERTRKDLIAHLGLPPERVHTVWLGADPSLRPPTPAEREEARRWLGQPGERPLVAFVGALGSDDRKGFGPLWTAWRALCSTKWDAVLVVAGDGSARRRWQATVRAAGLEACVRFLGHTDRIADVLAAADLLVSPTRYDAYGLNVQEALCRDVPVLVSARAGSSERIGAASPMLLPDPEDAPDLARRLFLWRSDVSGWKDRARPVGKELRKHTWSDMAARIVSLAEAPEVAAAP